MSEEDVPGPAPLPEQTPEPQYVVTLEELQQSREAVIAKEIQDRSAVNAFLHPDTFNLKTKLLSWASTGFKDGHVLYTLEIMVPSTCADGVTGRTIYQYIDYLLQGSITTEVETLQSKLLGILLSTSVLGNVVSLHVFKG
jgi:hypothetical protein